MVLVFSSPDQDLDVDALAAEAWQQKGAADSRHSATPSRAALLVQAFKLSLGIRAPVELDSELMSMLALCNVARKESGMVP